MLEQFSKSTKINAVLIALLSVITLANLYQSYFAASYEQDAQDVADHMSQVLTQDYSMWLSQRKPKEVRLRTTEHVNLDVLHFNLNGYPDGANVDGGGHLDTPGGLVNDVTEVLNGVMPNMTGAEFMRSRGVVMCARIFSLLAPPDITVGHASSDMVYDLQYGCAGKTLCVRESMGGEKPGCVWEYTATPQVTIQYKAQRGEISVEHDSR